VPENAFAEYSLQTPFKLQASTALVLGKKGILSFEYEYVDYSNMTMKDVDGYALGANNYIKQDMTAGNNIKVGGEFRVTPQFSLRGGYAFQSSPYKASVINQSPTTTPNVFGSTLPNYALDNGTNYYSGGFGYRFGSYYTDFAVVSRQAKEDVYAFSPISNGNEWVVPEKATLKTNTTQILFTFGYKY
jgi:long-subunit fatty acid transport protein